MFSTPNYTTKAKENHLINGFIHFHDMVCNCNGPAKHCLNILIKKLAPELSTQEKQQIQKCLTTTTTEDADGDADPFGLGDLEDLFAEGTTEDVPG